MFRNFLPQKHREKLNMVGVYERCKCEFIHTRNAYSGIYEFEKLKPQRK